MKLLVLIGSCLLAACVMENGDKSIPTQQKKVQCLRALAGKDNFAALPGTLCTGVKNPAQRAALNSQFDQTTGLLVAAAERGAEKQDFLNVFEKQINSIDRAPLDTEDAEQVASTFQPLDVRL